MEEVAAGQAGGGIRRRGTGRRAPEEADDDRREEGLADEEEEEEPDDKYLDRTWVSQMLVSLFLVWAKAQPLTHPPAWLTAAREAGAAAGEKQLNAARHFESLSVLSLVQEAFLAVHLCLYKLGVVSAARTLETMKHLMAVGIVASAVAAAASAVAAAASAAGAAGDDGAGWREVAAAVMLPLMPAVSAVFSFLVGELRDLFRR